MVTAKHFAPQGLADLKHSYSDSTTPFEPVNRARGDSEDPPEDSRESRARRELDLDTTLLRACWRGED